ncbi:MAG: signal peptidase I [Eubacteriales bacterium]|nr:signal peptidase I [Eubacteriales bacterium]
MKFIKWILNGLAGSIVILGAAIFMLRLAGICPYAVLSGSMEPVIPTGGIVFTDTTDRQPAEGDVITYQLSGTTVTHRVIRQEKYGYITKGDANQGEDANPVLPSQIVGTVCFSLPVLGFVVSYLQNRAVLLLILAAAVLSLLAESKPVLRAETFNRKKEKGERGKGTRGKTI